MKVQKLRSFTKEDDATWNTLFSRLQHSRTSQAHPLFTQGVELLEIPELHIPDLEAVNRRLASLTGFRGIPVQGLEDARSFFEGLANYQFPIGNFLRAGTDINYTPEPDIFHDLYGHLPLLADKEYAEFSNYFGRAALEAGTTPEKLRQFERLYWFGVEFSLIETSNGRRIFGGGILSSFSECNFALSSEPEVLHFDVDTIRLRDYRIDAFQTTLFLLQDTRQLYRSIDELLRLL